MKCSVVFVVGIFTLGYIGCPPVEKKKETKDRKSNSTDSENRDPEWMNLEYGRYLREVVQILEADDDFRQKLEDADVEEIRKGNIANYLDLVGHGIRTKLDELKRQEIERLRRLNIRQYERSKGIDRRHLKVPTHLNYKNAQTFEVEDLKRLIVQTTRDLEAADEQRRTEFKKYEMEKAYKREHDLQKMEDERRQEEVKKHEESVKRHKDHPKIHHPGARAQLEEVWQQQDHMQQQDFDPNTFFKLHDLDGDGKWDRFEVKALFQRELNKVYDPNNPDDDPRERAEEMERMREHVFNESDTNNDGAISLEEFLIQTKRAEFEEDDEWQGLDEQPVFTDDDYRMYVAQREAELQQALAQGQELPGQYQYGGPGGHPNAIPHGVPPPRYQGGVYPGQGGMLSPHPGQGGIPPHPGQGGIPPPHPGQGGVLPPHPGQGGVPPPHPGQGGVPPSHPGQGGVPPSHPGQGGVPPPHPGQGVPPSYPGQGLPSSHTGQGGVQSSHPGQGGIPQPSHTGQEGVPPHVIQGGIPASQAGQGSDNRIQQPSHDSQQKIDMEQQADPNTLQQQGGDIHNNKV